jgi:hypothetical protein
MKQESRPMQLFSSCFKKVASIKNTKNSWMFQTWQVSTWLNKKGIWVGVDHCVPQALHALYQQSSIGWSPGMGFSTSGSLKFWNRRKYQVGTGTTSMLFTIWSKWPKENQSWHTVSWCIVEETLHCHKMELSILWRNEPFSKPWYLVIGIANVMEHSLCKWVMGYFGLMQSPVKQFYTFCWMHGSSTNS